MKYNSTSTKSYAKEIYKEYKLDNRNETLIALSTFFNQEKKNGKTKLVFNEKVIDLDKIENLIAMKNSIDKRSTMDMAFVANRGNTSKIIISDFKLNLKDNLSSFDKSDILKKVSSTKTNYHFIYAFNNFNYFIFPESQLQKAKSKLLRIFGHNKPYKVISITELYNLYFSN